MDGKTMSDAMGEAMTGCVLVVAVVAVVVGGLLGALVMWRVIPSYDSVMEKQQRQAVIETLTTEQRKALGVK